MKGYTLIEMIVSMLILAIILLGGTTLFYQNLKSAGLSDTDANLNNTIQAILRSMEKDIRFSEVTEVGTGTRLDCLTAGTNGLSGDSLYVNDINGQETVYSLKNNRVASTSSQTSQLIYLSSSDIKVESLLFTWYCQTDVSDKIKIAIKATSNALSTGINATTDVSVEINLLNSGVN